MQNSRDYQRLLEACTQDGCLLCRLTQESTTRFLEAWKYDLFTDVSIRQELRQSQGFCNTHTWQLAQLGATFQLAQAYRDILSDTLEELQAEGRSKNPFSRQGHKKRTLCPACHQKNKALFRLISTLRKALLDTTFYTAFRDSHGLCLEHFQLACEIKMADTPGDWLTLLRQAQLICLQRLDEQIGELIRKHDYRFKDEARGKEMISWKQIAGLVAGENEYTQE